MKTLVKLQKEADKVLEDIFKEHFEKHQKEFGFEDAATLGLFEDMVGKVKSLIILLKSKKYYSIDSNSRGILESYVMKQDENG